MAQYVATRPGVALAEEGRGAEGAAGLAQYAAERPGSTGLFGPDAANPPDLAAAMAEIGAAPWHWHVVLSMRGPDAARVGLGEDAAAWRDLARRWLPAAAKEMGMRQGDFHWVAAMHHKVGKGGVPQPHLHVLAWAGGPGRPPRLSRDELRRVRRATAREVFGPMRGALAAERTARRDAALSATREVLAGAGGRPAFVVVPRDADLGELRRRLRALGRSMPGHGRVALAYQRPEGKAAALALADWLLGREALRAEVAAFEAAAAALAGLYGQAGVPAAVARARADVRNRVAQQVLRAAAGRGRIAAAARRAAAHVVLGRGRSVSVMEGARRALVDAAREAEETAEAAQADRAAVALGVPR